MGLEGAHDVLLDALADFPAQCLLGRVGLLEELLNILGTPYLNSSASVAAADSRLPSANPVGADGAGNLTPLAVMDWLERLLINLQREYTDQIDGSLASGMAPHSYAEGESNGLNTAFRMVISSCS